MVFKEIIVKCETGIQAKQAAELVQVCSHFASDIFFKQGGKKVNAKSIMGVISMALKVNDIVTLIADGNDENEAVHKIINAINSL